MLAYFSVQTFSAVLIVGQCASRGRRKVVLAGQARDPMWLWGLNAVRTLGVRGTTGCAVATRAGCKRPNLVQRLADALLELFGAEHGDAAFVPPNDALVLEEGEPFVECFAGGADHAGEIGLGEPGGERRL